MNDLISREEARNLMYHKQDSLTEYDLDSLPSVDAEPVRHGHWIGAEDNTFISPCYECSVCGRKIKTWAKAEKSAPYCHCGAKMDGE